MSLIPSIDLRNGQVVRLQRGDDRKRTVYDVDPAEVLAGLVEAGVERAHIVDLDAAFGEPSQRTLLESLVASAPQLRIQVGGGLRDRESIEWALGCGCDRAVVTSLMVRDLGAFAALAEAHPRRLVAAVDIDGDRLRISGWTESAPWPWRLLTSELANLPIAAVLVTDIQRDGMLDGPNVDLVVDVARASGVSGIVSGGVRSADDIRLALQHSEIASVIVGKALFDGQLELAEAVAAAEESRQ